MTLTRDFKDTIKARAERDPAFRVALLEEALDAFLNTAGGTWWALLIALTATALSYWLLRRMRAF